MLEFFLISRFVSYIIALLIGAGLIWLVRKKTEQQAKDNHSAGFWMRALCFGTDMAIIELLNFFIAYHGSLRVAGYISLLITLSYFFFFWLFFSTTPAAMFGRIKIVSHNNEPLKIWQILARLGICLLLFVGWIVIFFDKKEKKILHDIVAKTKVIYTDKKIQINTKEGLVKILQFLALGVVAVLAISLIIFGRGEKITKYTANSQIKFFDLNQDIIPDGLTMDFNQDGKIDAFKYDLDNDHIVNLTTFDTDSDGIAESIDVNNDGRIDGFDFDNNNTLDAKVFSGQFFIWFWRIWFSTLLICFASVIVLAIWKEIK